LGFSEADSRTPPENFEAVVEAHWTAVYRLLHSLSGHAHDTEDLTQETFLRALRRWSSFKQGTNLRAWLLRIATNAYFDVRRKRQTLKINSLSEDVVSEETSAETSLNLKEQGELVRLAMMELTELTRLVFHLRVTEDLSFKEIAEQIAETPGGLVPRVSLMKCESAQTALLQAEQLQPKTWPADLAEHVKRCAACTRIVKDLRKLEKTWREQPVPEECETAKADFLQKLAKSKSAPAASAGRRRIGVFRVVGALLAGRGACLLRPGGPDHRLEHGTGDGGWQGA
jgi:RNA polymerase sigma factor (sigma-70 family)